MTRPRPRHGRCPYPGCTAVLGTGKYLLEHVEATHLRCACGWVGAARNHGRHVGQVRRRQPGEPEHRHLVVEALEPPEESYN